MPSPKEKFVPGARFSTCWNAGIAYDDRLVLGAEVELVVPGNASVERKKRILAHGAKLTFTDPIEGYDEALRTAHRMAAERPDRYFLCDQYANEWNWCSTSRRPRKRFSIKLRDASRTSSRASGPGGTITGVGRRLKESIPGAESAPCAPKSFPGSKD